MSQQTLSRRVDTLEQRMDLQEQLSDRLDGIESQLLKFGDEVRAEFSALRMEFRGESIELRGELRGEIRAGDEETRRQMRMLHQDVIARLTLIQEGRPHERRGVTERPSRHTKR
jgi:hypothetical protein